MADNWIRQFQIPPSTIAEMVNLRRKWKAFGFLCEAIQEWNTKKSAFKNSPFPWMRINSNPDSEWLPLSITFAEKNHAVTEFEVTFQIAGWDLDKDQIKDPPHLRVLFTVFSTSWDYDFVLDRTAPLDPKLKAVLLSLVQRGNNTMLSDLSEKRVETGEWETRPLFEDDQVTVHGFLAPRLEGLF